MSLRIGSVPRNGPNDLCRQSGLLDDAIAIVSRNGGMDEFLALPLITDRRRRTEVIVI